MAGHDRNRARGRDLNFGHYEDPEVAAWGGGLRPLHVLRHQSGAVAQPSWQTQRSAL